MPTAPPDPAANFTGGYLPARRSWRSLGKGLGILLLVSAGITVLVSPGALRRPADLALNFSISLAYGLGLWLTNGLAVDWLDRYLKWSEQPVRRLFATLAVSLGGSLVVILLIQVGILLIIEHSLAGLWGPSIYGRVLLPLAFTVIISLFNHGRSFFLSWRAAAVRAERLEKESAVARLDSLRRQVDPHFLFNSLNALTSLVEENDPARAVRFISQLSQVYRYVLDSQSHELVPLADEVRFAESYLFLQQTRLGDALAVEINLPPAEMSAFFVPPLALQLLLENVIKHNTALQVDPLHLRVTLDPAAPSLTVRNTRRPRPLPPGEASGLGLKNLMARYAFLTDKPVQVGEEAGEFIVTLPLLRL